MKLRPESQKLLVELVKRSKVWGAYEKYTGTLAAVVGGILPEGAQTRVESYTEQDCSRAKSSLLELSFWGFISLTENYDIIIQELHTHLPRHAYITDLGGRQWYWLQIIVVGLTPTGVSYIERSWYRKWWGAIPSDLRTLIIMIAALLIYYFIEASL